MIIDETSMVSVWMLEAIDIALGILRECRDKPMGGMQLIFVGDFMQHPPVYVRKDKTVPPEQGKMAFKSPVWAALDVQKILLTKIFRQENTEFAELLNTVRKGEMLKGAQLLKFNTLLDRKHTQEGQPLYICHKRADVSHINTTHMEKLERNGVEKHKYKFPYMVTSKHKEDEEELAKMVRENLNMGTESSHQVLFKGMRVMLVRNTVIDDTKLVNGDTGTIVDFDFPPPPEPAVAGSPPTLTQTIINNLHARYQEKGFDITRFPVVRFDRFHKHDFQILPTSWGRQEINPEDGEMIIRVETDAVPLIAAWAITSHRCQGSTIADIPITINADCMQFCEGSFYVAVSRCRKL
jgi:ATP-dependent exoDNAse (exonuclease V) alpha subunit